MRAIGGSPRPLPSRSKTLWASAPLSPLSGTLHLRPCRRPPSRAGCGRRARRVFPPRPAPARRRSIVPKRPPRGLAPTGRRTAGRLHDDRVRQLPPYSRVSMATACASRLHVALRPPRPRRAGEHGLWAGTGTHRERLEAPADGRWGALETLRHRALAGPGAPPPCPRAARPALAGAYRERPGAPGNGKWSPERGPRCGDAAFQPLRGPPPPPGSQS